ncbi:translation elongation factor Ts [Candidatus Venteria ishoeyi]|uniref:Elongation factor Ts n=1 Tax=Candidatus Venteria ishoeyi TaxID=1899563 RepID=A0A1H6FAA2_9GAMM|nr:translation elongation factor Ts [Candidatus Venteria ishoeyi]MDM8547978.1 translation elongation factor Ts [Candidatus Venteria ishoeyi]SEH05935.1 Elongation factor Ts [Candidatus Venteria ishoeyi]
MQITAALVKELRERTGAGMMECKKALVEHEGDIDAAIEAMRISGQAQAAKKAGRVAAEGLVSFVRDGNKAALAEVNCETDFVSKGDDFKDFCDAVAKAALDSNSDDVATLADTATANGQTVEGLRKDIIAKLGENMNVRRVALFDSAVIGNYMHGSRIGVTVTLDGGDEALAKDIAMHVAASRPLCIAEANVDPAVLEKEKGILIAQAQDSGKPADIIEKMIQGRLKKYLKEITLLGQPFVKDPDQSVEKLLKAAGATVTSFVRYEVGEGIEKKTENFAEEVMQQAAGN